jgi:hypothetical protein
VRKAAGRAALESPPDSFARNGLWDNGRVFAHEALAATATLVAAAFAMCTFERWLDRRKRHELAWTIALVMFAAGSVALWAGASLGWNELSFRAFYLFGAVVDVPFLALGTVALLASERAGRIALWCVALFAAFGAGVVLSAPMHGTIDPASLPQGSDVFDALPRVLAAVGSAVGAVVVAGGAAWSAVRLRGRRSQRRLVIGNVLILLGTVILGAGGILNSTLDAMDAFSVSLVAGIVVLFAGFLTAATTPRAALRLAPPAAEQAAG